MQKHISQVLLLLLFVSCGSKQESRVDVSAISVDFSIDRFDIDFYSSTEKTLHSTQNKYPFFFSKDEPDSIWIHKINNAHEKELFSETQKLYKEITFLEGDLERLFKHVKYYNSAFKSPKVITLLSNIDAQNKVIYTKEYLLISLDVYLGAEHPFYNDYPQYIKQNFNKNRIVVDVANAIINSEIKTLNNRSFISKMVEKGLQLYLLDVYLPKKDDEYKIGYSTEKLQWAIENETQVWKYFIENKLLFSTETKLNKRFLDNAPFSKFYRSEDNLSPGKIGAWIGWQIVRSYMKHNDVSLQKLVNTPTEVIYKKSKYKPKK